MTNPISPTKHALPEGYTTRPLTLDDAEAYADLGVISLAAKGLTEVADYEDVRADWQSPDFDLAQSSLGVFTADGDLIGEAIVWDTGELPVQPRLGWDIHPEHMNKGIEQYLIEWTENRAHQALDRCPPNAQFKYRMGCRDGYKPREAILAEHGYEATRYWLRMVINMEEAPPIPNLADGFIIRPYNHPDEFEALVRADDEGFKDHWGYVDEPFEKTLQEWEHWLSTDRLFDPSIFFLAIEEATGEIAGVCLCRSEEWGRPDSAYVDSVAVLRQYRRKGLAKAMLNHAFGEFWKRDRKTVALHVDATSLTGATRVYEAVGMHADDKWATWEKVIREGEDLTTTSAE